MQDWDLLDADKINLQRKQKQRISYTIYIDPQRYVECKRLFGVAYGVSKSYIL